MTCTCCSKEDMMPYTATFVLYQWSPHTTEGCSVSVYTKQNDSTHLRLVIQVCDHFSSLTRGGRGRKTSKGQGRPKGMTPKVLINSIKELAPDPLVTPESDPQILGNRPSKPEVRCVHGRSAGSCRATLQPIVCASCCINSVAFSASTKCRVATLVTWERTCQRNLT
jgi:hypothetical protein